MNDKLKPLIGLVLGFLIFSANTFAQINCDGRQLFSEKSCAGDAVAKEELELVRIINDYRQANDLPALSLSEPLSIVANRRLIDLKLNVKKLTHSWSNCVYDIKDEATWTCVLDAPQKIGVNYRGKGYENLFRNLYAPATPALALEAWKKSPLHNALILNSNVFEKLNFDGIGVALDGQYAAIWIGAPETIQPPESKGLGIGFEKAVAGLTNVVAIRRTATTVDSEKWSGISKDRSVALEVYGKPEDIMEATISISIRLEKDLTLSERNRNLLHVFINNLVPGWTERDKWTADTLKTLVRKEKSSLTLVKDGRAIEMSLSKGNTVKLRVSPHNKQIIQQF